METLRSSNTLTKACRSGFSYNTATGTLINGDAPANNAQQCINKCNAVQNCEFWDFGNNICRLYSTQLDYFGGGVEPNANYECGVKNCKYGTFNVILCFINISSN